MLLQYTCSYFKKRKIYIGRTGQSGKMINGITTTNDFSFSTEADIDCFYENATSLYSNDTVVRDEDLENADNTAMFIMIYGLGGALVFYFIYSICTAYCMHVKGHRSRDARREFAEYRERLRPRRLVWPRNPSAPMDPPVFEREYISEEMRDMLQRNTRPKQIYQNREQSETRSITHACAVNERGYMTEEFRDMLQRSSTPNQVRQNNEQIELRPMSHAYPVFERGCLSEEFRDMIDRNTRPKQFYQNELKDVSRDSSTPPESETKFFPEDIPETLQPNTVPKQVRRSREHDDLRSVSSASSIPAIHDRSFFYEDFPNAFRMNTIPNQVDQSFEEIELRPWICTSPTPQETEIFYREDNMDTFEPQILPEGMHKYAKQNEPKQSHIEIDMTSATPERVDSVTERKSRSSPCSPHNVRRRLHSITESPRRPSSWRT